MAALTRNLFSSPINMILANRALSTSAICCKAQAGRFKRTRNRSKPLTYEQFNAPHQIHHRKSWNTWNTIPHSDKSFQTMPQVFDRIGIRTLSCPGQQLNDLRMIPVIRLLYCGARSGILLKNK
ncbi:28S ribosomal protein S24, mitochondrial [Trichonephila clavipes]|nr:28S ribosomal protein S24, mitochondrial [Trichonephila clavipes]